MKCTTVQKPLCCNRLHCAYSVPRPLSLKSRRQLSRVIASSGSNDTTDATTEQPKGFGNVVPKTPPKSGKSSMTQYREVLAAEQEAKAAQQRADAAASASTSGRRVPEPVEETPVVVTDRMLQRIVIFAGIPVFVGFLLYPMFYYLKVVKQVELPMGLVYIVQAFTFGCGLLGISYAVLSTSWDANRPGSFLGWTELQGNLPLLMDRFRKK